MAGRHLLAAPSIHQLPRPGVGYFWPPPMKPFENNIAFARAMDQADPLRSFRDEFLFPTENGLQLIYFTGNSLGLQPKGAAAALKQELDDWARFGVEGHFKAKHPWFSYHEELTATTARLVGAKEEEVVVMNQLTSNLHFLLVSFYRPSGKRKKILTEQRPFPSDTYAFASQIAFHGGDPEADLVEVQPRAGEPVGPGAVGQRQHRIGPAPLAQPHRPSRHRHQDVVTA